MSSCSEYPGQSGWLRRRFDGPVPWRRRQSVADQGNKGAVARTALNSAAESSRANLLARLDVQNLIREIGLIAAHDDLENDACHEPELEMAKTNTEANDVPTDKEGLLETKRISA